MIAMANLNIKFSHTYWKMPLEVDAETPISDAMLLAVFNTTSEEIHEQFRLYDTMYVDEKGASYYELPKGKLIILLLKSSPITSPEEQELWTTIRRWTPEKEKYYRSNIGKLFDVIIEEKR
jgi:hypothetical protein